MTRFCVISHNFTQQSVPVNMNSQPMNAGSDRLVDLRDSNSAGRQIPSGNDSIAVAQANEETTGKLGPPGPTLLCAAADGSKNNTTPLPHSSEKHVAASTASAPSHDKIVDVPDPHQNEGKLLSNECSSNSSFSVSASIASIASKVSKLSAKASREATSPQPPRNMEEDWETLGCRCDKSQPSDSPNIAELHSVSSTRSTDLTSENNDIAVPSSISTSGASSIFTPRQKELHFMSVIFRQDYHSWLLDDVNSDDDDDEDEDDDSQPLHVTTTCAIGETEYAGRTNFNEHRGGYRKSHEIGAFLFAHTIDFSDDDTDSSDEE